MDLDFDAPFRCLDLNNVLKVFMLMLMEERLLFISSSTSILTETLETLLAFLFPLEFMGCYIPRLPNKLHEILDAPGSFLLGIHVEGSTSEYCVPNLSDPIFIVDLDHNRITHQEGKTDLPFMEGMAYLDTLHDKIKLELERANISVRDIKELHERDSAFELAKAPNMETGEIEIKLDVPAVRDAFLCYMCDLLGNYKKFFNSQDNKEDQNGVFMAFDVKNFVDSCEKTTKPLMEKVVCTQMFAALIQQRIEHGSGVDRLVFFEYCVEEREKQLSEALPKKKEATRRIDYNPEQSIRSPPRSPEAKAGSANALIHQVVALSTNLNDENSVISPPTSPRGADGAGDVIFPSSILVPGPGIKGCAPEGTVYTYNSFPVKLNKSWMQIPSSALHPVLIEISKKRRRSIKKGNRMILARSVSECMKDWNAIGEFTGTGHNHKEIHLALQIFGIYFMSLPSRVSFKGRPIKVIMQALGLLQFILEHNLEQYMDEAMWRSLLVACGRCGHAQTRKIAVAIFDIMRRGGMTINALTYGQYTKAISEKNAVELFTPIKDALELDDCPWLEDRGRTWYAANCEVVPVEIQKSPSTKGGLRNFMMNGPSSKLFEVKPKPPKREKREAQVAEGVLWTSDLQDPMYHSLNTSINSGMLDSNGVVGMWTMCICMECQYMPLDEEIMSLRKDLLRTIDESAAHQLLCPKCNNPLSPKLYFDITTAVECRRCRTEGHRYFRMSEYKESPGVRRPISCQHADVRGEVSGAALGTSTGGQVAYMSPFNLRMKFEKLLLEIGEEVLTREWARENQPELYWNLVWYSVRLALPFPLLLETLDPVQPTTSSAVEPPRSDGSTPSIRQRQLSRRESSLNTSFRFPMNFHEVVVVGIEGFVVHNRCQKIVEILQKHSASTPLVRTPEGNLSNPELEILPLSIQELFPNIIKNERAAIEDIAETLRKENSAGLKKAVGKYLYYRKSFDGWVSEAMLGNMYRVFFKIATNYNVKKLHAISQLQHLSDKPAFETEYTNSILKLDKMQREQAEKDEKELLKEMADANALKFRSVFGNLYST